METFLGAPMKSCNRLYLTARLVALRNFVAVLFLCCGLPAVHAQEYTISWFGNSLACGGTNSANPCMQVILDGIFVSSNGTIYTNNHYDELSRNIRSYQNGTQIGYNTGFSFPVSVGGSGIYSDGTYLYADVFLSYDGGNLGYPTVADGIWYGVRRYYATGSNTGKPAPWVTTGTGYNGAFGPDGSFLVINQTVPVSGSSPVSYSSAGSHVLGIATATVSGTELLYALDNHTTAGTGGDTVTNQILVYNAASPTTVLQTISLPYDGWVTQLVSRASDSSIWMTMVSDGDTGSTARVLELNTSTNTITDSGITGLQSPTALAWDNSGNLMVADNGTNQQILFYDVSGSSPGLVKTFGQSGGWFAASEGDVIGQNAPDRFQNLLGVGMDSSGLLYVAFNGQAKADVTPNRTNVINPPAASPDITGEPYAIVRSFTPSGSTWVTSAPATDLEAEIQEEMASVDPGSETDIYSDQHHFTIQYPAPPTSSGGQADLSPVWSFEGTTLNGAMYPNDPRILGEGFGSSFNYRINGNLFSAMIAWNHPQSLWLFRYNSDGLGDVGQTAIPSGAIVYGTTTGLPGQPSCPAGANNDLFCNWTWIDSSGNGDLPTGTFTVPSVVSFAKQATDTNGDGWQVDASGNIWFANNTNLQIPSPTTAPPGSGGVDVPPPGAPVPTAIYKFTYQGLDGHGNPEYSTWDQTTRYGIPVSTTPDPTPDVTSADLTSYQRFCPAPTTQGTTTYDLYNLQHLYYDSSADAMFLSGATATDYNLGLECGLGNQQMGSTLIRYNNWSTTPTVAWKIALPMALNASFIASGSSNDTIVGTPMSFSVAGDFIFVAYNNDDQDESTSTEAVNMRSTVRVLNKVTGDYVVSMRKGILDQCGLLDMSYPMGVYQRAGGDYIVTTEDDVCFMQPVYDLYYGDSTTQLTASATTVAVGANDTFTATVASTGSNYATPTGTVTFSNGTTQLCSSTLTGGSATCSASFSTIGNQTITAQYAGDATHMASTSAPLTITVVADGDTETVLTSASNNAALNTPVNLSVHVSALVNGVPTGNVFFYDSTQNIGSSILDPSGTTALTTSFTTSGTHSLTAAYTGDGLHSGSTSSVTSIAVAAPITPQISMSLSPTTMTVQGGGTGSVQIAIQPSGGFSQTFTLSAAGLPASSTVSFSPASFTPNGSNTALSSTMTFSVPVTKAALDQGSGRHSSDRVLFLSFLFLLPGVTMLRSRTRRLKSHLPLVVLFVIGSVAGFSGLGGCGSGIKTSTLPSTTAYAVTITATPSSGGTAPQTATLSLTVQN